MRNQATRSHRVIADVPPKRSSGGKRSLDEAQSTDPHIATTTKLADAAVMQPPLKKKVTYELPHQNMDEGHFYVVLGEDVDVTTQRFKILSLLGEGTFGKVVEAWDRKRKEYCAVKVVRNTPRYTQDATYEILYMQSVLRSDPTDRFAIMKVWRFFANEAGHTCIVMPKCGRSTLDHIQRFGRLPHRHLAELVFHVAAALDFMHTQLRLMHTDLKPENILFEDSATMEYDASAEGHPAAGVVMAPSLPCRVRVCDLGGCCDEKHAPHSVVSTRHYRSPEVILGLGWMFSTDMWSMGCIIYELATGRLLYDTHDNLEHLHLMEKTLGPLPAQWATKATTEGQQHFKRTSSATYAALGPPLSMTSTAKISRARSVREMIAEPNLCDLILSCLTYDRSKRISARRLMTHPYIAKYFPQSVDHPNHPRQREGLPPEPLE